MRVLVFLLPLLLSVPAKAACVNPAGQSSHPVFITGAGLQYCPDGDTWTDVGAGAGGDTQWVDAGSDIHFDAGNVGIHTSGAPSAAAALEIGGTTKGFLPPRMTDTQRDAIAAPVAGLMIYNTDSKSPQFFNGTVWMSLAQNRDGSTAESAATNCKAILANGFSTGNGVYWVLNTSGTPFQAYCDMTYDGGGWMLVLNLDTGDGAVRYFDTPFWTDGNGVGNLANALTADYKNATLFQASANDILIAVHDEGAVVGFASWSFTAAGSLQSKLALPANTVITAGGKKASSTTGIHAREVVILPAGNLVANFDDGTSDRARLRNSGGASGQNITGGIGYHGDSGMSCSRPCVDAAINATSQHWNDHWLGTDIMPSNQYGSPSGLAYDYAIFVR